MAKVETSTPVIIGSDNDNFKITVDMGDAARIKIESKDSPATGIINIICQQNKKDRKGGKVVLSFERLASDGEKEIFTKPGIWFRDSKEDPFQIRLT